MRLPDIGNRQDAASTPRTTWTCLFVWCGDPASGPLNFGAPQHPWQLYRAEQIRIKSGSVEFVADCKRCKYVTNGGCFSTSSHSVASHHWAVACYGEFEMMFPWTSFRIRRNTQQPPVQRYSLHVPQLDNSTLWCAIWWCHQCDPTCVSHLKIGQQMFQKVKELSSGLVEMLRTGNIKPASKKRRKGAALMDKYLKINSWPYIFNTMKVSEDWCASIFSQNMGWDRTTKWKTICLPKTFTTSCPSGIEILRLRPKWRRWLKWMGMVQHDLHNKRIILICWNMLKSPVCFVLFLVQPRWQEHCQRPPLAALTADQIPPNFFCMSNWHWTKRCAEEEEKLHRFTRRRSGHHAPLTEDKRQGTKERRQMFKEPDTQERRRRGSAMTGEAERKFGDKGKGNTATAATPCWNSLQAGHHKSHSQTHHTERSLQPSHCSILSHGPRQIRSS